MNEKQFIEALKELKIDISAKQLEQLNQYYKLLSEWNQKINLTAIIAKDQVYLKHFYDSLTLTKIYDFKETQTLCDIGTGAGFPGLVLKIIYPNLKITLIDSLEKRIKFLKIAIETLQLNDIEAIHSRAEDYVLNHRNEYDLVTSRAVAKLNVLNELCLPLLKINGLFLVMKGSAEEEIKEAENSLKVLSSEVIEVHCFTLPIEESKRTIIKIQKKKDNNNKYPRNFEKIKKNPL